MASIDVLDMSYLSMLSHVEFDDNDMDVSAICATTETFWWSMICSGTVTSTRVTISKTQRTLEKDIALDKSPPGP